MSWWDTVMGVIFMIAAAAAGFAISMSVVIAAFFDGLDTILRRWQDRD